MKEIENEALWRRSDTSTVRLDIEKVWAFIKKGFVTMTSYKLNFVLTLATIVTQALSFYFIGRLFEGSISPYLTPYGGSNYTNFVLWGVAFQSFIVTSLSSFANEIRREQLEGTLELVLMSPTRLISVLFCSSIWNHLFASINTLAIIAIAATFLGLELTSVNIIAVLLMLALTVFSTMGIGLISAGIILVTKMGEPVNWVFTTLSIAFSGVYYPIEVMPQSFQFISAFLPLTYGLKGMRLALMEGVSINLLMDNIVILLISIIITWLLGYLIFHLGFMKAKIDGSLAQY